MYVTQTTRKVASFALRRRELRDSESVYDRTSEGSQVVPASSIKPTIALSRVREPHLRLCGETHTARRKQWEFEQEDLLPTVAATSKVS